MHYLDWLKKFQCKKQTAPQRPFKYLIETAVPTEKVYVDLCIAGNKSFSCFSKIEAGNAINIISWRTTYLALYNY